MADTSLILEVDALKGWKLSKLKYSLVYQLIRKTWKMNTVIDCLMQYFTSATEHWFVMIAAIVRLYTSEEISSYSPTR